MALSPSASRACSSTVSWLPIARCPVQLQGRGALGQLLVVHRDVVREHPTVARARVQGVRGLVPDAVGFLGHGRVALVLEVHGRGH
jgi:hypothetical protein